MLLVVGDLMALWNRQLLWVHHKVLEHVAICMVTTILLVELNLVYVCLAIRSILKAYGWFGEIWCNCIL